jgi:hypothetical protein
MQFKWYQILNRKSNLVYHYLPWIFSIEYNYLIISQSVRNRQRNIRTTIESIDQQQSNTCNHICQLFVLNDDFSTCHIHIECHQVCERIVRSSWWLNWILNTSNGHMTLYWRDSYCSWSILFVRIQLSMRTV